MTKKKDAFARLRVSKAKSWPEIEQMVGEMPEEMKLSPDAIIQTLKDAMEHMPTGYEHRHIIHDDHIRDAYRYTHAPMLIEPMAMDEDSQKLWAEEYEEFYFEPMKKEKGMKHAVLWVLLAALVVSIIIGGLLLLFTGI